MSSDFEAWKTPYINAVYSSPPTGNTALRRVYKDPDSGDIVYDDTAPGANATVLISNPPAGMQQIVEASWDTTLLDIEFRADAATSYVIYSDPPAGKKRVTNAYWDPTLNVPVHEVEP